MGIRSILAKPFAAYIAKETKKWAVNPGLFQENIRELIVSKTRNTVFGTDHGFADIKSYDDFKKQVPIRDYEALSPYVNQILEGKSEDRTRL